MALFSDFRPLCVLVVAVNISGFDFFASAKDEKLQWFQEYNGKKSSPIFFVFLVIWTDKFFQWFGMKKLYSIFIRIFFSSIPINSISSPSMKLIYNHSGWDAFSHVINKICFFFLNGIEKKIEINLSFSLTSV